MAKRVIVFMVLYLLWIPILYFVSRQIGRQADPGDKSGLILWMLAIGYGVPGVLGPYLLQRTPGWQKTVLANGRRAPAVIRQIKNDRWADRRNRYYELTVEVQPPGEAPFLVTFGQSTDWKWRSWEERQPGDSVYVKYDPHNPRHTVVTDTTAVPPHGPSHPAGAVAHPQGHGRQPDPAHQTGAATSGATGDQSTPEVQPAAARPPAPPADLAGELERLAKLRADSQLTAEEYEAAKRKLLA